MAKRGMGTTITINGTTIGKLTSINPPELSADTIDTTTLDVADNHRTFMQGLIDAGEVSVTGFYENNDTGHTAVKTALDSGTADTYVITFPSTIGSTWTFTGVVTKFKTGEATIEDGVAFEASFKVSGKPTLGVTASTGMSAATFVQTDGSTALTAAALTPTFAIGTFTYGFTYTTQTAFKPKFTAASHTIQIFVNDVYIETVSSGVAASSIAMAAVGATKVTAVVFEAGKTPKTYVFMVSRLS